MASITSLINNSSSVTVAGNTIENAKTINIEEAFIDDVHITIPISNQGTVLWNSVKTFEYMVTPMGGVRLNNKIYDDVVVIILTLDRRSQKIYVKINGIVAYYFTDFKKKEEKIIETLPKETSLKEKLLNAKIIKLCNYNETLPYSEYVVLEQIREDRMRLPTKDGMKAYTIYQANDVAIIHNGIDCNTTVVSIDNDIITINYVDSPKISFRIMECC